MLYIAVVWCKWSQGKEIMKANREQILCHCLSLADLNDLILQLLATDFFSSGHLKVKSRDMRTLVKSYLLPYFNIQFQKNFQNKNYKISSYIPLVTIAVTQNTLKQQAIYLWYVIPLSTWINKVQIYTIEYYSTITKMPFAATWMQLQIIVLGEVSQRKTNTMWYHLYVESKKRHKRTYLRNRKRYKEVENKLVVAGGKGLGKRWSGIAQGTIFNILSWKRILTLKTELLCCTAETNTTF